MIEGITVTAYRVMDYLHVVLRVRDRTGVDRDRWTYVIADIKPTDLESDINAVSELGHLCHLVVAATTTQRARELRGSQLPNHNPLVLRSE